MAVYFADTMFWVALVDRRDGYHSHAVEWSQSISGSIVTTQAVLLETANALSRHLWRQNAIALIDHLQTRDDVEVEPMSSANWTTGWNLFRERHDKSWSLTDCISFEVMRARSLTDALTADMHFRQAGFRALWLDS
jgi:uncharacterized protein